MYTRKLVSYTDMYPVCHDLLSYMLITLFPYMLNTDWTDMYTLKNPPLPQQNLITIMLCLLNSLLYDSINISPEYQLDMNNIRECLKCFSYTIACIQLG